MLTIIFLLIWRTVATVRGSVKAYAPSNIAITYLRSPRGLKWAIPAALIAIPTYLYIAWLMTVLVDRSATEWLYLITVIAWVDACKYAALAVITPFLWLNALAIRRGGMR
jgi:hypothetical protein